ncbi:MAG TPA: DUF4870 domain-containing protein [Candidatus Acidoferrum sp.]|nr:DUF4870 domain-containing protein [Candidatus Acidoferrum sp.]
MAHCTKCGAALPENAAFCAGCGAPQTAPAASLSGAPTAPPSGTAAAPQQMAENIAGLLCYVVGWITGLIFYFVDKRPYVRFHATQSITLFGGLHILWFLMGAFFGFSFLTGGFGGLGFAWLLVWLLDLVVFVLWIVLMIKAYQGQRFRVPIVADIAEKIFGKF